MLLNGSFRAQTQVTKKIGIFGDHIFSRNLAQWVLAPVSACPTQSIEATNSRYDILTVLKN